LSLAYRSDSRFSFTCANFTLIKPPSNQPIQLTATRCVTTFPDD
jgi:hypothetical protein